MSGIIGHTMYAIHAVQIAEERKLPIAPALREHFPSYLAGAYLGCDIQVMPEAVCMDTGREVGFGTVPLEESPLTGGAVRQWFLVHDDQRYRPGRIHELFYGRSHLVFGWRGTEVNLAVPWDHLADYWALVVQDWRALHEPSERGLAWLFGWMVHIVGDSLIKSVRPGITMHLLDGIYTPRNRPIQDLYTFHEIGVKEMRLQWAKLFDEMAATPVEPIQLHYMRIAPTGGALGRTFTGGWKPEHAGLLQAVLRENHRWVTQHAADVLRDMALTEGGDGPVVSAAVSKVTSGLTFPQMIALAEKAQFRRTLRLIAEEAVGLFERVLALTPR
ncbi:MAG: hypothetical protein ABMA01_08205 [Chthoniobacteraceae bacterium]